LRLPGGTRVEIAAIAETVAVLDVPGQHISDGLDATVRMARKTGAVIVRPVVAEIVKQQERIELAGVAEAEGAIELYARAFDGWL
jgi:hypothetical protein